MADFYEPRELDERISAQFKQQHFDLINKNNMTGQFIADILEALGPETADRVRNVIAKYQDQGKQFMQAHLEKWPQMTAEFIAESDQPAWPVDSEDDGGK